MDLGLQGKTAIVTGGSRGIGKAIAKALAREGVDMALVSRNVRDLEATAAQIAGESGRKVVPPDYVRTSSRSGGLAKVEVFLGSRASLPADGARSAALASLPRAGSPRSQEAGPLPRKAAGPG